MSIDRLSAEDRLMVGASEIWPQHIGAIAFIDGQNLYRHAKDAFGDGYHHPNYDPIKLTDAVCVAKGWERRGVRFYTGTHSEAVSPMWHGYWARRTLAMRRAGVLVTTRPVRYQTQNVELADGAYESITIGHEKGIDLRLALDAVRLTLQDRLDVALIFSQDQDLAELATELKEISKATGRWVKVACAFPASPQASSRRGIDGSDWFEMDLAFYSACIDPYDYRPKPSQKK